MTLDTLYLNLINFPIPNDNLRSRVDALTASRTLFRPTGERNARRARCANPSCRQVLPRGAGHQWDYERNFGVRGKSYFCHTCHNDRLAMLDIQPAIAESMAAIEAWCMTYVNLRMGRHAIRYIDRKVHKCGLMGADVAVAILERLPLVEDASYLAVVRLTDQVVAQLHEPVD
jgi:hypothetical protein